MPIRPDHGHNRNGYKQGDKPKQSPVLDQSQVKSAVPATQKASKATSTMSPSEAFPSEDELLKKEVSMEGAPMTERQRAVTRLDLTSPKDLCRLRDLLAPEYDTLAANHDRLLQTARGQYVLIHEKEVWVHANLDAAMEDAYNQYPNDLFFVGRVHERDFREYLNTYGSKTYAE